MAGSTGLSLNDRFTRLATVRERSRSRSRNRDNRGASVGVSAAVVNPPIEHRASEANVRLLRQLVHKHQMRTALKLKRKSMRTAATATAAMDRPNRARGTMKALRVAANGRPIKLNSLGRHATMRADLENQNNRRRRGLLRAPFAARRRVENILKAAGGVQHGGRARSRSRSRPRAGQVAGSMNNRRARSRSRTRISVDVTAINSGRARSRSRGRQGGVDGNASNFAINQRGHSRSRTRGGFNTNANRTPVTARLGVRPGATPTKNGGGGNRRRRDKSAARQGQNDNRRRGRSAARLGVQRGGVQKRDNVRGSANKIQNRGGRGARVSRSRVRLNNQNIANGSGTRRGRSQSRGRRGGAGQQQQQGISFNGRRGRSQQRNNRINAGNDNAKGSNQTNRNQSQQRRGRSRSRNRAAGGGRGRGGNQGRQEKLKREDLDNELDQYMSTTQD